SSSWRRPSGGRAPALEDLLHLGLDPPTRLVAVDTAHQEVVIRVSAWRTAATTASVTASRSRARAAAVRPTRPPAAPPRMHGDRLRPVSRAAREQPKDLRGELVLELHVLAGPPLPFSLASAL